MGEKEFHVGAIGRDFLESDTGTVYSGTNTTHSIGYSENITPLLSVKAEPIPVVGIRLTE